MLLGRSRSLVEHSLDWFGLSSDQVPSLSFLLSSYVFFDTNHVRMTHLIMHTLQVMFLNPETGTVEVHGGQVLWELQRQCVCERWQNFSSTEEVWSPESHTWKKTTKWVGLYHRNMMPDSAPLLGFDLLLLITSPIPLCFNPICFWAHYYVQFQCPNVSLS